jgi:hypothetical protein
MKFIIGILVTLIAAILSGIIVLVGINDLTNISYRIWFLGFTAVVFTLWKLRFRTEKRFRYFLLRNFVKANRFFRRVDKKMTINPEGSKPSDLEEKAIRLWKLSLRNKSTQISCSIPKQIRQLQKDNMLIMLSPLNNIEYMMTIIDTDTSKRCLYEVPITQKQSEIVISAFDTENEKRMRKNEQERRNSIHNDLDSLLRKEEEALSKKIPQL